MAVLNMLPRSALIDRVNCGMADSKNCCNYSLGFPGFYQLSDLMHIHFVKLSHRLAFAFWWIVSSFLVAVQIVIRFCSKPKMLRVNANPIVASVQHAKAIWNWTIGKYPSNPMSRNGFTIEFPFSVSSICTSTPPLPAFVYVSGIEFREKSLKWWRLFSPPYFCSKKSDCFSIAGHLINLNS